MTLAEAAAGVGRGVVYTPHHGGPKEDGVITSVNDRYVFVRYGARQGSSATEAADLEFLARPS